MSDISFDDLIPQKKATSGDAALSFDDLVPARPAPFFQYDPAYGQQVRGELGRQAGLMARTAVKGITGIPAMVGDAANAAVNYGVRGINAVTGSKIPELGLVSDAVNRGLDATGLPKPNTVVERLNEVAGSALFGAGGAQQASRLLSAAPGSARLLGEFAKAPVAQAVGAATGLLATEGAQGMGIKNPYALMGIGMIGSVLPGGASKATLGTLEAASKPFANSGREIAVGNVFNNIATNPELARARLNAAQEIVPGSRPMVSQASRDPGLASAENAMRGFDQTGQIPARIGEQNLARQTELYKVAGDEGTLAAAKAFRDKAIPDYRDPAFANKTPITGVSDWENSPVKAKIDEIRKSPEGARQTVKKALAEVEAQLTDGQDVDLTNPETLYSLRKDLALARDGKLSGQGKSGAELANLKSAKTQLDAVIDVLDNVIETGAPGYKEYLKVFHERSVPLDQIKAAQKLRAKAELAIMDQAQQTPILGTNFTKLFRNNLDAGLNLRGKGPKAGNLTPEQIDIVARVAADIDRGAAAQASTVRAPGSETFKNLSLASVVGRILGDKTGKFVANTSVGKAATNAVSFLYRIPEQQIQQLMVEAWLDPKLAAQLMKKATDAEIESLAKELGNRLAAQTAAQSTYGRQ